MEEKGFLTSAFGEATLKRGGKCIYYTTSHAIRVLEEMRAIRADLWSSIPLIAPELKMI